MSHTGEGDWAAADQQAPPHAHPSQALPGQRDHKAAPAPAAARQPQAQQTAEGLPPLDPRTSEATRLLCAGAYLDDAYRDAVADELYLHQERIVAPSSGIDAARVLAHTLRARRMEAIWALATTGLWVLGFIFAGALFVPFAIACAVLQLAAWIRGRSSGLFAADFPGAGRLPWYRRWPADYFRVLGRWLYFTYVASLVALTVAGDSGAQIAELLSVVSISGDSGTSAVWFGLGVPLAMALCAALYRERVASTLGELAPPSFPERAQSDLVQAARHPWFAAVQQHIQREQHSPLVFYQAQGPFRGSGSPYEPWTLAVELRPRKDARQVELNNQEVLRRVVPLVASLRTPAAPGTEQAAAVRDRLRALEIDECVFLPATGLPSRGAAPRGPQDFADQRARAVEEGGELRRHFLRIRVGAWREEVVITVFVRVHTQGRMLMLEFAPHVLRPIRAAFRSVDRISDAHRRGTVLGKGIWALGRMPTAAARSVICLFRQTAFLWRMWTGGFAAAMADGPWSCVRELGSDEDASLFQEMDVSRYLKSIQDRVANGVRLALEQAGWQTGEFEQQIINVSGGGVYFSGSMSGGAITTGKDNTVTQQLDGGRGGDGHDGS